MTLTVHNANCGTTEQHVTKLALSDNLQQLTYTEFANGQQVVTHRQQHGAAEWY